MVDPQLAKIIAAVESGGSNDTAAIRFEPGVYSTWTFDHAMLDAQHFNRCSSTTAKAICAISWGRYQILGYNLYLDGYAAPVVNFAASPSDQDAALDRFLTRRAIGWTWAELAADPVKAQAFVERYNGPAGWPGYFDRMKAVAS